MKISVSFEANSLQEYKQLLLLLEIGAFPYGKDKTPAGLKVIPKDNGYPNVEEYEKEKGRVPPISDDDIKDER
ncbi:hypothetical protein [Enterococcus sp. AZ163]|uniref:hypothetical protein n=1 Tax=Enterococcus sp. AZ163 TaxID=2774638 RepID=UPI003D2B98D6